MSLNTLHKMNMLKMVIPILLTLSVASCASAPRSSQVGLVSTNTSYKALVLNGKILNETDLGSMTSWRCQDYINGGKTVVEVGLFSNPELEGAGFVLYDNSNSGEVTSYERKGVNHRWDWGPNGSEYAFVIKTDGIGYFYDFTVLSEKGTASANDTFKCSSA